MAVLKPWRTSGVDGLKGSPVPPFPVLSPGRPDEIGRKNE